MKLGREEPVVKNISYLANKDEIYGLIIPCSAVDRFSC